MCSAPRLPGGHGECALEQQPVQHEGAGIRTGGGRRSLHLDAPAHVRTQPGGDEPAGHARERREHVAGLLLGPACRRDDEPAPRRNPDASGLGLQIRCMRPTVHDHDHTVRACRLLVPGRDGVCQGRRDPCVPRRRFAHDAHLPGHAIGQPGSDRRAAIVGAAAQVAGGAVGMARRDLSRRLVAERHAPERRIDRDATGPRCMRPGAPGRVRQVADVDRRHGLHDTGRR